MAYDPLESLIDKSDNFELIRDQIGAILVTEVANQVALATAEGKPNPQDWNLQVYTERSNPWEKWLNVEDSTDTTPIVNIWFDNDNFAAQKSNVVERQHATATFNIDCYGYGLSQTDGGTGHTPGDMTATREAQRALRLVRNILMAAKNAYLQFARDKTGENAFVWQRWTQSRTVFQPEMNGNPVQNIIGSRLVFMVEYNELAPETDASNLLEIVSIDVTRAEDGALIAEMDFDYTI